MTLCLEEANRMIEAAIAKGTELNIKISVAVCDAGGHLLAFSRMDDATLVSATASQGKAVISAHFGRPSGAVPPDKPAIQAILATHKGKMIPAQGALPAYKNNKIVGAIGCSGGTDQQDEDCAKEGTNAL